MSRLVLLAAAVILAVSPAMSADWLQMDGDTRPDVDSSADYVMAEEHEPDQQLPRPEIYSLHVTSLIQLRYAITMVTSRIANPANISQEIFFNVVLPSTAFISGFTMEVDGKLYKGHVEERNQAKRKYQSAVRGGQTAAHITQSPRDSARFMVSVSMQPGSTANLSLKYEELLMRSKFGYLHTVNIDPGQIVPDLYVGIQIVESTSITYVKVPSLKVTNQIEETPPTDTDPLARLVYLKDNSAVVHWFASPQEQRELQQAGVRAQLVVTYDVDRASHEEQILVSNDGYFVHFFSPNHMAPLRKHVIFVLDCSQSMMGVKMDQVKAAMETILHNLNKGDFFSLIFFATKAKVWSPGEAALAVQKPGDRYKGRNRLTADMVVPATSHLVTKAVDYLYMFEAHGSTNLNDALHKAFKLARLGRRTWNRKRDGQPQLQQTHTQTSQSPPESMVVLLTDGLPTRGRTDAHNIARLVTRRLNRRGRLGASLFALGFGEDVDMGFLKTLALRNSGFARKIYEAADAALQLRHFYGLIASPLLANVSFRYQEPEVSRKSLTETRFPYLYRGSELVVAGRLGRPGAEVAGKVTFRATATPWEVSTSRQEAVDPRRGFESGLLERLWAHLTVRQLLDRSGISARALRIALKYSFVTSMTSMIVVKPYEVVHVEPLPIYFQGASESASGWPLVTTAADFTSDRSLGPGPGDLASQTDGLTSYNQARGHGDGAEPGAWSLDDLQWLRPVTDGYQVALPTGANSTVEVLELGSTELNLPFQPCFTPDSTPGHCRHLPHCVTGAITSTLSHYLLHFCRIGSFAGVCCPDEEGSL